MLVAAAGRGTRAGLPYPKTLYPVGGTPILVRILRTLAHLDPSPTVVVSPSGYASVRNCLSEYGLAAHLVEQAQPKGMGDAVLCFRQSPGYSASEHVLLIWGDIPFVRKSTVDKMIARHFSEMSDFTLVTAHVPDAYTIVERTANGGIASIAECRELGLTPAPGERDVGLFIFRRDEVLDILDEELPGKFGQTTGEHGFLYVVRHLASRRRRIIGLPIATKDELVSLNAISDLDNASHDSPDCDRLCR